MNTLLTILLLLLVFFGFCRVINNRKNEGFTTEEKQLSKHKHSKKRCCYNQQCKNTNMKYCVFKKKGKLHQCNLDSEYHPKSKKKCKKHKKKCFCSKHKPIDFKKKSLE